MSEARSTAEAYLSATNSSDLRVKAEQFTDADRLLAAAYAVSGNYRKKLALKVYRLRATGDMSGAHQVADEMAGMLCNFTMSRKGGFLGIGRPLRRVIAHDVAMVVLKWHHRPACPTCGGRGHPMIEGTPVMDDSRDCQDCRGSGTIPLERLVRTEYVEHARWLASELDGLSSIVFAEMANLLRRDLDL